MNACIRLLRINSAKEREDGSVYLETSYNSKILWKDEKPSTKKLRGVPERSFIVQRMLTYLKHDMVQVESYIIKIHLLRVSLWPVVYPTGYFPN